MRTLALNRKKCRPRRLYRRRCPRRLDNLSQQVAYLGRIWSGLRKAVWLRHSLDHRLGFQGRAAPACALLAAGRLRTQTSKLGKQTGGRWSVGTYGPCAPKMEAVVKIWLASVLQSNDDLLVAAAEVVRSLLAPQRIQQCPRSSLEQVDQVWRPLDFLSLFRCGSHKFGRSQRPPRGFPATDFGEREFA